jgi:Ca-activated chloride channel homolog
MMSYFLKIKAGAALLFCSAMLTAQPAHKDLRQADKAYQNGNFPEAELGYRKAIEKDNSVKGNYNLGNTTYRQEHYDESIKHYQAAAEVAKDRSTKARAYHNLGNALYKKGQYKESVEAYKNALRQNPNDIDTKRNLTNALRRLPPPQQQNQQNDKKDNKDKDKQNQENQQQKDSDQSPDQNQDQNQKQKSSGQKEQPQDLNKQEAKELLEIMDQEEQKVQQKLKKAQAKKGRSAKDW